MNKETIIIIILLITSSLGYLYMYNSANQRYSDRYNDGKETLAFRQFVRQSVFLTDPTTYIDSEGYIETRLAREVSFEELCENIEDTYQEEAE